MGAELRVRDCDSAPPYHCHIFFCLTQIDELTIDTINLILDELYSMKAVTADDAIPKVEDIAKRFDEYEFVFLPHGG